MDLLSVAKEIADRVEAEAARVKVPVSVCVIDTHGNIVLQHRVRARARAYSRPSADGAARTAALSANGGFC
jgi:uncharacterized protein GlcG (DUF336 family)